MTSRGFTLIALALGLAYVVAYSATRKPVCRVESASRATVRCAPLTKGRDAPRRYRRTDVSYDHDEPFEKWPYRHPEFGPEHRLTGEQGRQEASSARFAAPRRA
jgi:hypothetical protein